MKLFSLFFIVAISSTLMMGCKKESAGGGSDDGNDPKPGSGRSVTVDITYVSGLIENTNSWATWPVAIFPTDAKAVSYKVRLYGFNGTATNVPEGQITIWKAGELPPTDYNIYKSTKDIKDGKYYFTLSRTWCSGCTKTNPDWEAKYKIAYGTPKAEVTYQY
jgi:hypothetical protein